MKLLPASVRAALDDTSEPRRGELESLLAKMDGEVIASMLYDHRMFGSTGARYFDRKASDPFLVREIGILLSGQDVGKWDTDPGVGTLAVFIGTTEYFRVPLAAMPSHAGPIWQRRVSLPIAPHLSLMPGERYAVDVQWPGAPPVAPTVFLDGWLFRGRESHG